ncbi:MAG: potassium channel protein [Chloroflexi bacterium]|nr:potassium channel protein [Chloroflexota bacterium]
MNFVRTSRLAQYSLRRLLGAVVLLGIVITGGTVGYWLIEGWTLLESLYMTMITITTIGYGEPRPLSSNGTLFTLVLIVTTIGIIGYSLSTVTAFIVEGEFNRILRGQQMDRRIQRMRDHVILCGCGSTGLYIAESLHNSPTPFVVVELNESRIERMLEHVSDDVPYIMGDATQDEILRRAGIEHAKGLLAAVSDDKDNVFIVLTARSMKADLRIVARLINEDNAGKLRRAGADEVVSPNAIGGQRMASVMMRPSVVSFLDELSHGPSPLGFDEIPVNDFPSLIGKTLGEAHIAAETGMLVVAIHNGADARFNPGRDAVLHADDVLLVIGTPEQRAQLERIDLGS